MRTHPNPLDGRQYEGRLRALLVSWPVAGVETALRRLGDWARPTSWLREHESLRTRSARTRTELWEVVERIERWERPLRAARRGRRRLEGFERDLAAHIAREEAGGHLESVLESAPRYQGHAERLRGEHAVLLREIRCIRTMASGADVGPQEWAEVYEAFDGFAERLRLHDEAENDIVAGALLHDLGPGD